MTCVHLQLHLGVSWGGCHVLLRRTNSRWQFRNSCKGTPILSFHGLVFNKKLVDLNVLKVLILKVFQRQRMVPFIGSDSIMQTDRLITPECTTLETIKTVFALFVAISTLHTACIALFYGQNIEQTVNTKVCRQCSEVSILRDSEFLSAFRACNHIWVGTRSLNPVQAMKSKTLQARQLFWICEIAHTRRTRKLLVKII